MTIHEAQKLANGVYRVHWKAGGSSVAAVGRLHDGTPWFAPVNWTAQTEQSVIKPGAWRMIDRVERVFAATT